MSELVWSIKNGDLEIVKDLIESRVSIQTDTSLLSINVFTENFLCLLIIYNKNKKLPL